MKILSLSNCPLVESQGSGYVIVNFCRGLRDRGHQVDLYGPDAYEPLQFLRGRANSYRQAIGMVGFALQQLARQSYDLVEFYGGEAWLAAQLLSRVPGRRFVLVSHSNGIETNFYETLIQYAELGVLEHPFGRWYQANSTQLFRAAFTRVDGIVTVGHFDRQYALQHHYQDENHVVAIENPLPPEYLALPVTFGDRPPVIGYCGSWIPRKGIDAIKTDLPRLLQDFPDYRLQIIGVGPDFRPEEHFPGSLSDRLEVIPYVEEKQTLKRLYQQMSVLIVPSIYESFGLTIAEAMACGCPVVASRTGFAAGLVHEREAYLLPSPISPDLYQGVRAVLQNPELRQTIAQGGYQRVQSLTWPNAIDQIEQTYQGWIAERMGS